MEYISSFSTKCCRSWSCQVLVAVTPSTEQGLLPFPTCGPCFVWAQGACGSSKLQSVSVWEPQNQNQEAWGSQRGKMGPRPHFLICVPSPHHKHTLLTYNAASSHTGHLTAPYQLHFLLVLVSLFNTTQCSPPFPCFLLCTVPTTLTYYLFFLYFQPDEHTPRARIPPCFAHCFPKSRPVSVNI
jgi:hypothetical protein